MLLFCCASGVETDFMPWLMDSVDKQLNLAMVSRHVIDMIINEVVCNRAERYSQLQVVLMDEPEQTEQVAEMTTTGENEDQQRASYTVLRFIGAWFIRNKLSSTVSVQHR